MFKKIVCCALICSLILALCSSCTSEQSKQGDELQKFSTTYIEYFDTASVIVGFEKDEDAFNKNCEFIEASLKEYNQLYDIYKSYEGINNIRTINKNAGIAPVKVDKKIIDLLDYCLEIYEITNGMTNVAMGSVLSIWHDYRTWGINDPSSAELPPMDKLKEASNHCDISKVQIDRENNTVYLSDPDMSLDVGAVAKGYATEQIGRALSQKGVKNYTLNIGGNIKTLGPKGDGLPWIAAVADPNPYSETGVIMNVELNAKVFVTSGSYQRYYTVDGKEYHHIIHPETLMPHNDFTAVSIYTDDSGLADALSTALFNMSYDEGKALVESLDNVEALWVTSNYEVHYSKGFEDIISKK